MADDQKIVVTPNAFDNGFLNRKFAQQAVDRIQRPYEAKTAAPFGDVKIIKSAENVVFDFTKLFARNSALTLQLWVSGTLRTGGFIGKLDAIP